MCQQTSGPELVGCYVVFLLSLGSLGLIPIFFIPLQNVPKRIGSTILPPRVGWLLRKCCVHPLSLGSLGLTLPKNGRHHFAGQSWLVVMLWSNYDIQTWKHGRYKSKYGRVMVAMMRPSSISLVSQFPFTDNCRGHSLFVIDYNPTPPPPPPPHPPPNVIDFVQY